MGASAFLFSEEARGNDRNPTNTLFHNPGVAGPLRRVPKPLVHLADSRITTWEPFVTARRGRKQGSLGESAVCS